jgi:hypothetical protein
MSTCFAGRETGDGGGDKVQHQHGFLTLLVPRPQWILEGHPPGLGSGETLFGGFGVPPCVFKFVPPLSSSHFSYHVTVSPRLIARYASKG